MSRAVRRGASAVARRLCAVLALAAIGVAAGAAQAEALSRADYAAHKRQIDADLRADQLRCRPRTGADRNLCLAQAEGRHKVALAELDFNASGKESDAARLAAVKGDSDFLVAKQRCAARVAAADRPRCLEQAEAARAKAPGAGNRAVPLRRF